MPEKAACGGWPVVYSGAVSDNEFSAPRLAWTPDLGGKMPPRPGIRKRQGVGSMVCLVGLRLSSVRNS